MPTSRPGRGGVTTLDVLLSSSSSPLCFPLFWSVFPPTFCFRRCVSNQIAPHLCRSPLAALYIQAVLLFPGQTTLCVNSGQRRLLLGWGRGLGRGVNHCISNRCSYQCEVGGDFSFSLLPRCFKDTAHLYFLPSLRRLRKLDNVVVWPCFSREMFLRGSGGGLVWCVHSCAVAPSVFVVRPLERCDQCASSSL